RAVYHELCVSDIALWKDVRELRCCHYTQVRHGALNGEVHGLVLDVVFQVGCDQVPPTHSSEGVYQSPCLKCLLLLCNPPPMVVRIPLPEQVYVPLSFFLGRTKVVLQRPRLSSVCKSEGDELG